MSVLASIFALLWQVQQLRKECPADLSLLKCVEEIPFPSTPKSEWEREVRYTESEERIEDFINKYKEGPYVTLARERLQVAQAWTPIKNATDPHVLFDFLSYYRDPIFEKLANNSLQRLAKREWEREIKSTDSEEVLERFIDKYKVGSYVELAQKRLKVARDWTPIKNTNDPHTLFAFLSNHHDPIFEKLAQNSLQIIDDQAWQLAVSAGTREAITTYRNTWSAFSGRHLQDAQIMLTELDDDDAWKAASREDSPETYRQYLNHPWARHAVQAHKRLDELSEAEWEREVKNTDGEEVLEKFIGRYKEGPYVTLAQERLQIARAWTSIKNTTDPHALSAFLSKYHDPIFEKLANNSLQRLDDRAWQVALSAGTGDALEAYVKIWSALRPPGRHVEEAKKRLSELERTYWSLYENDPEAECPGTSRTSTMYSITEGDVVKFYYDIPSKCMQALFVKKDTLKFGGTKNGQSYHGKAYVFTKYCGGKSIGYDVSGSENYDHTLVTLSGPAPVIEQGTCRVVGRTPDSENSTLEFKARRTAKAKPSDKPDQIRR